MAACSVFYFIFDRQRLQYLAALLVSTHAGAVNLKSRCATHALDRPDQPADSATRLTSSQGSWPFIDINYWKMLLPLTTETLYTKCRQLFTLALTLDLHTTLGCHQLHG